MVGELHGNVSHGRQRNNTSRSTTTGLADLRWATRRRIAAVALAEEALATLESCDPQRRIPTLLLQTLRLGDAALVAEYRAWLRRELRTHRGDGALTNAARRGSSTRRRWI